jgi:exosortase O
MINIRLLHRENGGEWRSIAGTIAVCASWLYLNRANITWLTASIVDISPFNAAMLVGGGLLLAYLGWQQRQAIILAPALHRLPLIILFASAIGSIATQWLVALPQLPAGLFLLGCYGLLGLWLSPALWRRGLPVGIAIACLLPFGVQFGTGIGAPARIITAHIVAGILHSLQITVVSVGDVLVLDTGVSYVDAPCSGLKSMWTGTLFFLMATWLEGRSIGWRWMAIGLGNLGLLAIANTARVLMLTLLTHVWLQPTWAEMLHVPLGLIGFIMASLATWGLLRLIPRKEKSKERSIAPPDRNLHWKSLVSLSGLLLALAIVPTAEARTATAIDLAKIQWPSAIQTQAIDFNRAERKFFASYPDVSTRKERFQLGDLSGTAVLVSSPTWQAHHAPELCLTAMGHKVTPLTQHVTIPQGRAKWLSLNDGNQTAIYWFQSPTRTTDDFASRFWDEVWHKQSSWTMVSVVFDRAPTPEDTSVRSFIQNTHQAIDFVDR